MGTLTPWPYTTVMLFLTFTWDWMNCEFHSSFRETCAARSREDNAILVSLTILVPCLNMVISLSSLVICLWFLKLCCLFYMCSECFSLINLLGIMSMQSFIPGTEPIYLFYFPFLQPTERITILSSYYYGENWAACYFNFGWLCNLHLFFDMDWETMLDYFSI